MLLCTNYLILPLLREFNHAGTLASLLCKHGLPESRCTDQEALRHALDDIINASFTRDLLLIVCLSVVVLMSMASAHTMIRIEGVAREIRRQFRAQGRLQQAQGWQQRAQARRPRA